MRTLPSIACEPQASSLRSYVQDFPYTLIFCSLSILIRCNSLLTIGSFLLTAELLSLQLCFEAFLLTIGAFLLAIGAFCLQVELFCLQWESVSEPLERTVGKEAQLQEKNSNCKPKKLPPLARKRFPPRILWMRVHPETAPLQAECCSPRSTGQSTFRGEEKRQKGTEKLSWPFPPSASASIFYRCFFPQRIFPWESLHKSLVNTIFYAQLSQFEFPACLRSSSRTPQFPPPPNHI